ncbi:MAG: methyltransferase type 11 [Acidobacteria bacterium]|nr:methyltransferase type 11 [Acidobacteriota bacterium]
MREKIDDFAADFSSGALAEAAERLSLAYRSGTPPRIDTPLARAAYLATRMPATYGALWAAARELPFEPTTWLDLGAGPGTAAWVAPCPATLVETNPTWIDLTPATRIHADLTRLPPLDPHDVVSISYALNELGPKERDRAVLDAWSLARRALLLVEPGTVEGFAHIRAARTQLLALGAHIQAPCPHPGICPMAGGDWCHFAVRVERSKLHRRLKGGDLSYEDEKFSYLLALKEETTPPWARILRHPNTRSGLIELRICTPEGARPDKVRKNDPRWKAARKANWGSPWEPAQ